MGVELSTLSQIMIMRAADQIGGKRADNGDQTSAETRPKPGTLKGR